MGLGPLVFRIVFAGFLLSAANVFAHDWYPVECCTQQDCAPAETVVRRDDGSYTLTAHGMSVVIPADYPHWRRSPDGRIHVCLRKLPSGSISLVCAFRDAGL
jgi:hypothetical protein